jgi:hypothetical protein
MVLVLDVQDVELPLTIFALCLTVIVLGISIYGVNINSDAHFFVSIDEGNSAAHISYSPLFNLSITHPD